MVGEAKDAKRTWKREGEVEDDLSGVDKFTAVRPAPTPQIEKLQAQGESYKKKSEVERRKVIDLDRSIELLNAKLAERRRKVGGTNAPAAGADQVKKQIKILTNRLEKALQKHNGTMAANKKLRENIDNLRRERQVFDGLYKKLEKELAEKRKEMTHKIEVNAF
jgi:chromosome segregation ATPase